MQHDLIRLTVILVALIVGTFIGQYPIVFFGLVLFLSFFIFVQKTVIENIRFLKYIINGGHEDEHSHFRFSFFRYTLILMMWFLIVSLMINNITKLTEYGKGFIFTNEVVEKINSMYDTS